ncbi:MAG TPA: hypothetical protein VJL28_06395 [Gemmatimonadaceae bacterium]|nr:hypothetical protein [Gemmatimonadaceae bacterium]
MPITFHINAAEGVIYTTAQGVVTDADILAHKDAMVRHPDFRPGMRQLSDARLIERLDVSTAGVSLFAAHDGLHASDLGAHQIAIVVGTDEVFGMARMYQSVTEANLPGVQIFRDMDEARRWLGLAP